MNELSSSNKGLDDGEAEKRLKKYGQNDIPVRKSKSVLSLLLSQIRDPLMIALVVASFVSFFTGGLEEAVTILAIVVINIPVRFVQEYKSESPCRA